MSSTGMDAVPNLPKGQVRVWMLYRAYQRIGYGYRGCTKLSTWSVMDMDVLPSFSKGRVWYGWLYPSPSSTPDISTKSYLVSVFFSRGRTELIKALGTGVNDVPSLPKDRVRV